MPTYSASPLSDPPHAPRTGVLLVQLGTPDAPEAGAVRRYLRQFLSDPRVVEIPKLLWWPILNGPILTFRPKKSAHKYAQIWTPEGSPLAIYTARQADQLAGRLAGEGYEVDWAMRYGNPGVPQVLRQMRERGVGRVLVIPLYPQYAASTTASALDAVWAEMLTWRNVPELRAVRDFHDFDPYIDALAARVREHWVRNGTPDKLLMSFHGIPRRSIEQGDPYRDECLATARLLAARLDLPQERWVVTFQSRFGPAEWLQPYTAPTLEELGRSGCGRLDVICPGFVSDCLETLEEISMEGRASFVGAGGREFRYIPCLNDDPTFAGALAELARRHLAGWPT